MMAAGASRLAERTGVRRLRPAGARGHAEQHLFRSAYALMLNTVLTGGSGFLFWLLAARLYTPAQVGVDGALIALMASVSAICQLNLGNVYPRFLADATRAAETIALYETLGFETCADPIRREDLTGDCDDCQLVMLLHYRMIYTRRPPAAGHGRA